MVKSILIEIDIYVKDSIKITLNKQNYDSEKSIQKLNERINQLESEKIIMQEQINELTQVIPKISDLTNFVERIFYDSNFAGFYWWD